MINAQERAFSGMASRLFEFCAQPITIKRGGVVVLEDRAVVAKRTYADADRGGGVAYINSADFLISGSASYEPKAGDVVETSDSTYVVRAIAGELWRYDDPYKTVKRLHAQERLFNV